MIQARQEKKEEKRKKALEKLERYRKMAWKRDDRTAFHYFDSKIKKLGGK